MMMMRGTSLRLGSTEVQRSASPRSLPHTVDLFIAKGHTRTTHICYWLGDYLCSFASGSVFPAVRGRWKQL